MFCFSFHCSLQYHLVDGEVCCHHVIVQAGGVREGLWVSGDGEVGGGEAGHPAHLLHQLPHVAQEGRLLQEEIVRDRNVRADRFNKGLPLLRLVGLMLCAQSC